LSYTGVAGRLASHFGLLSSILYLPRRSAAKTGGSIKSVHSTDTTTESGYYMKIAVVTVAAVFAVMLYTAWLNGAFLRCPHCRKIGSWRYDPVKDAAEQKDEDGVVESSSRICVCRKCGKKVLDKWSDHEGRSFEKGEG
jgi:hypothetical protein